MNMDFGTISDSFVLMLYVLKIRMIMKNGTQLNIVQKGYFSIWINMGKLALECQF